VGAPPPFRPSKPAAAAEAATAEINRDRIVASPTSGSRTKRGMAGRCHAASATRLGVDDHVAVTATWTARDELLIHMRERGTGEERRQQQPPEGWRARLERPPASQWKGFRRHPWLAARCPLRRRSSSTACATEWALAALDSAGVSTDSRCTAPHAFGCARGWAEPRPEAAGRVRDTALTSDEWMSTQQDEVPSVMRGGGSR